MSSDAAQIALHEASGAATAPQQSLESQQQLLQMLEYAASSMYSEVRHTQKQLCRFRFRFKIGLGVVLSFRFRSWSWRPQLLCKEQRVCCEED